MKKTAFRTALCGESGACAAFFMQRPAVVAHGSTAIDKRKPDPVVCRVRFRR